MWLEDFTPSEWPQLSAKAAEVSEKFKESVKKSGAGMKRVQKDEQKAKKYDVLLAGFLTQIIRDAQYDELLPNLFTNLDNGYGSNFLLWILSLIYMPISDTIRQISGKTPLQFSYTPRTERIFFDDNMLDTQLKDRINFWVEDMIDIVSIEYSSLQIEHFLELNNNREKRETLEYFWAQVFVFFFQELNIEIPHQKAQSYAEFILWQVCEKIGQLQKEEI